MQLTPPAPPTPTPQGDPTAHAEIVAIRHAGRRTDWSRLVLVSTLSPCAMCTGTALLLRFPRVVVGEDINFRDADGGEAPLRRRGVWVSLLQDEECVRMMGDFVRDRPGLWREDIGEPVVEEGDQGEGKKE